MIEDHQKVLHLQVVLVLDMNYLRGVIKYTDLYI